MRNSLDSKTCCKAGVLFRIDLKDNSSSCYVVSERFNFECSHAARSAPRGPEINQHWDSGVPNDAIEGNRVDLDGLPKRR